MSPFQPVFMLDNLQSGQSSFWTIFILVPRLPCPSCLAMPTEAPPPSGSAQLPAILPVLGSASVTSALTPSPKVPALPCPTAPTNPLPRRPTATAEPRLQHSVDRPGQLPPAQVLPGLLAGRARVQPVHRCPQGPPGAQAPSQGLSARLQTCGAQGRARHSREHTCEPRPHGIPQPLPTLTHS